MLYPVTAKLRGGTGSYGKSQAVADLLDRIDAKIGSKIASGKHRLQCNEKGMCFIGVFSIS